MGKPKAKTTKAGRRRSAARDLAARKSGVKAGAVQASYQLLPYIEQDNMWCGEGRVGSAPWRWIPAIPASLARGEAAPGGAAAVVVRLTGYAFAYAAFRFSFASGWRTSIA